MSQPFHRLFNAGSSDGARKGWATRHGGATRAFDHHEKKAFDLLSRFKQLRLTARAHAYAAAQHPVGSDRHALETKMARKLNAQADAALAGAGKHVDSSGHYKLMQNSQACGASHIPDGHTCHAGTYHEALNTARHNRVNSSLRTVTDGEHDYLPEAKLRSALDRHGLNGSALAGKLAGREGQVRVRVGPQTHVNASWHRLSTGKHEITAHVD